MVRSIGPWAGEGRGAGRQERGGREIGFLQKRCRLIGKLASARANQVRCVRPIRRDRAWGPGRKIAPEDQVDRVGRVGRVGPAGRVGPDR